MRLIRFAIGMSVVAVSVIGSALAHSQAELTQVDGRLPAGRTALVLVTFGAYSVLYLCWSVISCSVITK
jgi:hypothetical protein